MTTHPLPSYADAELAAASTDRLIELLTADEDRAPRNLIDECARRGEEMLDHLSYLAANDQYWGDGCSRGEWWLLLHAVMILGLMPSARAGFLLVQIMRRMAEEKDDDLQDWLAGRWPALFRNKPDEVLPALCGVCEDRTLDWYVRVNAMESVVATAQWRGPDALDAMLAWVAGLASDESEEWDVRCSAGNMLVDFPRAAYRPLVEELARLQEGPGAFFSPDNVRNAYDAGRDRPQWERFDNPWEFYDPAAIAERQQRWEKKGEDHDEFPLEDDDDFSYDNAGTYVRPSPKIGRNDPCPCGSGKKYKRCCLRAE